MIGPPPNFSNRNFAISFGNSVEINCKDKYDDDDDDDYYYYYYY